jgi:hypothetical protein
MVIAPPGGVLSARYAPSCAEVGRDPAEIEWGVGVEPDDLERFLVEDGPGYLEMGFTQFTLGFGGPGWSVEGGRPGLAWRDEQNRTTAAATVGERTG